MDNVIETAIKTETAITIVVVTEIVIATGIANAMEKLL